MPGAVPRRSRMVLQRRSPAPVVDAALVLANVAAYAVERVAVAGGGDPCATYGVVPARFVETGEIVPLFTHCFLHDPTNLLHIAGNLVFLMFFGSRVERVLGHARFATLYLAASVGGALTHVLVDPAATTPLVGCSGCVLGLMAAVAVLSPRWVGFVGAYVAFNIGCLLLGTGGSVAVGAHVGGFSVVALGFVAVFLARRVPRSLPVPA
jgi:membrane associated rhomboid family serine protease